MYLRYKVNLLEPPPNNQKAKPLRKKKGHVLQNLI